MRDERGSITSVSDSTGTLLARNRYDEYGIPDPANLGRFGYTGQTWLPELGMWYYRARIYSPTLGRFLQTDPIGYGDGMNMYAYVGGDPVNFIDPLGLSGFDEDDIVVVAPKPQTVNPCDKGGDNRFVTACNPGGIVGLPGLFDGEKNRGPCGGRIDTGPVSDPDYAEPMGNGQGAPGFGRARPGGHNGIDIANRPGGAVRASGAGVVVRSDASDANGYGGQVIINHGGGIFSQSAHLGTRSVQVGDRVASGQVIGTTAIPRDGPGVDGNLSRDFSAHLHYEIRIGSPRAVRQGGRVINPTICLPGI
jgi:RHS repeat-associated protein